MNFYTFFIATLMAIMIGASFMFSQRIDALESKLYKIKRDQQYLEEIVYFQNIDVPEVVKTLEPKVQKEK